MLFLNTCSNENTILGTGKTSAYFLFTINHPASYHSQIQKIAVTSQVRELKTHD